MKVRVVCQLSCEINIQDFINKGNSHGLKDASSFWAPRFCANDQYPKLSGESLGASEGLDQNVNRNTNKKIRAGILLFKAVLIAKSNRICLNIQIIILPSLIFQRNHHQRKYLLQERD